MVLDASVVGTGDSETIYQVEHLSAFSTPERVRDLRQQVMRFLSLSPFSPDDLTSVEIAIGEACTNAMRHGSPRGADDEIRVKCMRNDHTLVVEITDCGCGFDPRVTLPLLCDELREDGMGLLLMRGLVDSVEFEFEAGTTVRLVKHRRLG